MPGLLSPAPRAPQGLSCSLHHHPGHPICSQSLSLLPGLHSSVRRLGCPTLALFRIAMGTSLIPRTTTQCPLSPSSLAESWGPRATYALPARSALSLLGHHCLRLCPSPQTWGGLRTWAYGVFPVPSNGVWIIGQQM